MLKDVTPICALRAEGCALIIDLDATVPRVLHWGADLGEVDEALMESLRETSFPATLNNSPDLPRSFSLWVTEQDGWAGTPAQRGNRLGMGTTPRPQLTSSSVEHFIDGGGRVDMQFADVLAGTNASLVIEMDQFGVISAIMSIENPSDAKTPYFLDGLRMSLPLPERANEILDFTGKWCRERSPQRSEFSFGTHLRHAMRGKPGHDSPFLMMVGTEGFGFGTGEIWGVHLAWSGDGEYYAERLPEGAGSFMRCFGAGEQLRSGEIILKPGERYVAPKVYFAWSNVGLDGIADRFHRGIRLRDKHPKTPRPLVLNTWEAVYFDHNLDRLTELVDSAARVGVERVVLDDGWFQGRRDDRAGLGDWIVDEMVWPEGLTPFVDLVRSKGMEFGLWVEPEMINPDSNLARQYPEWLLKPENGDAITWRNQLVLDLSNVDAYTTIFSRLSALVSEYEIDYLKWDHNRDLIEPVAVRDGVDRPLVHVQTSALYRLLDDLKKKHPNLEIETCSAGGGRVDLGILDRTDRLWASDCNDPVERVKIERWTRMLVPPELIGSHVGGRTSHTTSRSTDLSFRLVTALTSHAGIEADLTQAGEDEIESLATWSRMYQDLRALIHSGKVVNADLTDESVVLTGIISQERDRAIYTWGRLETSPNGQTGRICFPGLDSKRKYRIRVRNDLGRASRHEVADPSWVYKAEQEWVQISGALLAQAGVPLPTLNPQQAMLFEVEEVI